MYELDSYMAKDNINFIKSHKKQDILKEMVQLSYEKGKIKDLDSFQEAILDRENIISTGIGLGIAVPHAKLKNIDEFFVTVGILSEPVEWESIDNEPVSIIFMIGGPDNRQKEYLGILSKLVLFSKNSSRRKEILSATTPEEVINQFIQRS